MNINDPKSSKNSKQFSKNNSDKTPGEPSQSNHKFEDEPSGSNKREPFRNPNKVDEFFNYAKSNKEQTIAYILLALGLLFLLFFNNMLGGLIIGMVAGYYFASEIVYYIRNLSQMIGGQDQLRYVILTALLLGLFIAAPGIFIGAAIVAAFKQIMAGPGDSFNNRK